MKIFFFNANVTRQSSEPMQFVAKEINNDADDNNDSAKDDDVFTGLLIHLAE